LISFQDCKISPIILNSIAEQCSSLEKLDIVEADFEGPHIPAQYYRDTEVSPRIERYNNYKKELRNGFQKISMNCQNIYSVNFSGCLDLDDTMVNFIINNLLNLKYIRLDRCENLKDCFQQ